MATKDVEFELHMPAADPGPSGRTTEDVVVASREPGKEANVLEDPNEGNQEGSPETVAQDDEITAGEHETPAAKLSDINMKSLTEDGNEEEVLKDLIRAVEVKDVGAFNQHLAELERLLQDDSAVGERLTASGALCWAAWVDSTPMMDALIEKGVDINLKAHIKVPFIGSFECTPLHLAARHGRAGTVRHLTDKGADVNIKDGKGRTSLHLAAEGGNYDAVSYLVDKVADVNIKDNGGNAPLHLAAMRGHTDTVKCLVDSGAHVNIRNHLWTTPLHMATKYHRKDTVKFLVAHEADVNIKNGEDVLGNLKTAVQGGDVESFNSRLVHVEEFFQDKDSTASGLTASGALCYAAWVGSTPMMDALIEKGVDVNKSSEEIEIDGGKGKWTPLHVAARFGTVDTMIHLIEKGADVNIKMDNEWIPLHAAASGGKVNNVKYLVEKGANVNIKDNHEEVASREEANVLEDTNEGSQEGSPKIVVQDGENTAGEHEMPAADPSGRTPEDVLWNLNKAIDDNDGEAFNQHLAELERLLQDDSAVAERLTAGGALCWAAFKESTPMMDALIEKGVDVNIKALIGGFEHAPLHVAATHGRADTVRHLIDKGADVNIKDGRGWTPLHVAAAHGGADTVRHLIDKGADVNIKDGRGKTPLLLAAENDHADKVSYLVDKGADVNSKDDNGKTPLLLAAQHGNADNVSYLVDKGADVNSKDVWGRTPLHEVALKDNADNVSYLVDKGADVNSKDVLGKTPLLLAAENGNADNVSYLVDKGADVNSKDDDGRTPLHEVAPKDNADNVSYLVDKGADVNSKDVWGRTPIHHACWLGNAETVKYLLEKGADPTAKETNGWNSLTFAIDSRNKDAAAILLDCKDRKWCEEMLRSSWEGTTLMRKLIADMPDVAEMAFNKCVTNNEGEKDWKGKEVHATSDNFSVEYNYEFLEDFENRPSSDSSAEPSSSTESWRPKKFRKEDHPLNLMMKHGCSNLLKHPLAISLLELKWNNFGRYIFIANVFLYLIFLAFLTAFGLVVLSPVERTCIDVFNGSFNGTAPEDCKGLSIHEYRFLYVGAALTILTAILRLALEIFQLCMHPLEYLLDWVNWLEIPLYLFSIIFTFAFATPCLCVYSWQWQIGVVAVFLGWVGLITFLQKLPATGVYVLMFVNILGSFMKIAFLALLLVIAFAFTFYMLLFDPAEMRTPFSHAGRAVVKVMAMTTGELDFDELYHQQDGQDEIAFPPLSFLFWIIFLIVMPVLLSNLLVGLAVGDVDRLQKAASENRIKLQIDLVLSFEELLESLHIRHWFAIKPKIHYPNVPVTLLPEWCKGGANDWQLVCHFDKDYGDEQGKLAKVRRWIAKVYSKVWITDEYSNSGVKISDAIKPPPEPLEKQLQKQQQHLQAQLQKQDGHQNRKLETKLKEQNEQIETKLKDLLEVKLKERSEQLEAKLKEHSEKQSEEFQEAVKQLSECHKEQAKQSEEQAKRMEEQAKKAEEKTEQLAGEVASLRETLEKLVAQMTVK